jgi:hypothetical protein
MTEHSTMVATRSLPLRYLPLRPVPLRSLPLLSFGRMEIAATATIFDKALSVPRFLLHNIFNL